MIKRLSLKSLAVICNRYINADPQTAEALSQFEHKRLKVDIEDWNLTFVMVFQKQPPVRLEPTDHTFGSSDATVRTDLRSLITVLARPDQPITAMPGFHIEGDVELVRQLSKIMRRMEIDWEEQLSNITGDFIASSLGRAGRRFKAWGQDSLQSLKQDLSEYLHEELAYFPSREELEDFYQQVSQARDDLDRLEAKFNYLTKQNPY